MQYTLRQLKYLVAVADCGSVTGAAQKLHTSQPGISSTIVNLETLFGVQLFIRHHARGVTLTPAGRTLVAEARNLLAHAQELTQSAHTLGQSLQGRVALGCFSILAPIHLPRIVSALQAERLDISLQEGDIQQLQNGLLDGELDIALCYDLELSPLLNTLPLQTFPPYAVLPRRHHLAQQPNVSLAELAQLPMILLNLPHSREYFLSMFQHYGLEPEVRHQSLQFEVVRSLVAAGSGFSILNQRPGFLQSSAGQELACLPIRDMVPALTMVLAWPQGLRLTHRVELCIERCRHLYL